MPPKKRNRDQDQQPALNADDQLDKDELKGMLRQSLDERAELVVKNEELVALLDRQKEEFVREKEELEAKLKVEKDEREEEQKISKKREQELQMDRILLHFCGQDKNVESAFYANPNLLEQAEDAGLEVLLDIDDTLSTAFTTSYFKRYYFPVHSCTDLLDVFENGIEAGTVLQEDYIDPYKVLFSVGVIVDDYDLNPPPTTVVEGEESNYLVVCAESHRDRFSEPLWAHLLKTAKHTTSDDRMEMVLGANETYPTSIQDQVKALGPEAFKMVLEGVWIPNKPGPDGKETAYKADLDFNRMVEIMAGTGEETDMGFWPE